MAPATQLALNLLSDVKTSGERVVRPRGAIMYLAACSDLHCVLLFRWTFFFFFKYSPSSVFPTAHTCTQHFIFIFYGQWEYNIYNYLKQSEKNQLMNKGQSLFLFICLFVFLLELSLQCLQFVSIRCILAVPCNVVITTRGGKQSRVPCTNSVCVTGNNSVGHILFLICLDCLCFQR